MTILYRKMLSQDQNVVEELNEKAAQLLQLKEEAMQGINQPKVSTAGEEYWYKIYTPNRDFRYLTSNGAGNALVGDVDRNYARAMWPLTLSGRPLIVALLRRYLTN